MNYEYLIDLYNQGHSLRDLSKMTGLDHNKIWRAFIKLNVRLRDKSEATANAFEQKGVHPTKGKHHSKETREKIGEQVSLNCDREKRREIGKRIWKKKSRPERRKMHVDAAKKTREAATKGTKLEKYLLTELATLGYEVAWHCDVPYLPEAMHVDIFIKPDICIEVDGPSHFKPIYGEEKLSRTRESDKKKNEILLGAGYKLIRIRHTVKTVTEIYKRRIFAELKEALTFPDKFNVIGDLV